MLIFGDYGSCNLSPKSFIINVRGGKVRGGGGGGVENLSFELDPSMKVWD